ncbi:hypothetical protein [Streptomyces sp. NPDC101249]|uniref:hypothetical protein n=1 Tax=Streptomyces sp. NPDC101249 TaxID=3366140 RepID=UPI0038299ACD
MTGWDPREMAAMELYHQLVELSPENGERALIVSLRLSNGRHVGDVILSSEDVTALTDAARLKRIADDAIDLWPVSEDEAASVGEEAEQFLRDWS